MDLTVGSIKKALDKLGREELDDIVAYAKMRRSLAPRSFGYVSSTRTVGADPYDYVLRVICDVCRARGLGSDSGSTVDVAAAKNLTAYATFRKEVPEVIKYIESCAPDRVRQRALLRMAYTHLIEERVVQHVGALLSITAQVPTALNQMFPGYSPAGLMPLVTRKLGASNG